jgi:hypothetical protein
MAREQDNEHVDSCHTGTRPRGPLPWPLYPPPPGSATPPPSSSAPHGAITRHTRQAGCSRQSAYHHAARVLHAVTQAQGPGPSRAQLLADNHPLRQELEHLRPGGGHRWPTPDRDRQRRFAATASALGLSLKQTEELLGLLLDAQAPDRSTVGRWVAQAARQAGQVLATLDAHCRPQVHFLCLDEIFFHRQPILVGVEPHSFALRLCRRAADRRGATWEKALAPSPPCRPSPTMPRPVWRPA